MTPPLSIGMTPAFYEPEHRLLRAQLGCLARQTRRDFDVWLIDPHYQKRRTAIPELAERLGLRIVHVPYSANTRIAKTLDCAIFNAVFCFSEAPRIARYSCYRFAREDWVESILSAPEGVNVDFYYHNVKAPHAAAVWDRTREVPDWTALPDFPDYDTDPQPVPANCYGNIVWLRDQWLALNGTDEVFTNVAHYEDLQFDIRALAAGQSVVRRANRLFRLEHSYGRHSHRADHPPDVPFREPCPRCRELLRGRRWVEDMGDGCARLPDDQVKVCRDCLLSGPMCRPEDYCAFVRGSGATQATVLPDFLIGRNLRVLTAEMDGRPLTEKVERFDRSWHDPRFYVPTDSA